MVEAGKPLKLGSNELSVALYLPWDFAKQERPLHPSLNCIQHLGPWILQE